MHESSKPDTLFFLHLPKTAGTTLNRILEQNYGSEALLSVYTRRELERFQDMTEQDLEGVRLIQGHVLITDFRALFQRQGLGVFTFLRHPVERLLSEYFFLKNWPHHHLYGFLQARDVGLMEYVTSLRQELVYRGKNPLTRTLSGVSFGPREHSRAALDTALEHLVDRFAMFGMVERFDESLILLKRLAGLQTICYERHNVHLKKPPRKDIEPHVLEVIAEHNQLDLELFERAGSILDQRLRSQGSAFAREVAVFEFVNARYQKIAGLLTPPESTGRDGFLNVKE